MDDGERADRPQESIRPNTRIWHPWLRVKRLTRVVLTTSRDSEQWPVAKLVLGRR